MHSKATQKLHPTKRHQFLIGIITVIFVGKGHSVEVDVFDACIADGYPMGVLPQVIDHLPGIAQRRLRMNHPGFSVTKVDYWLKLRQTVFLFQVTLESFEQFATKSHAQLTYRIKVFALVANLL